MAIDQLIFCSKLAVDGDGDDEIISWAATPSSWTGGTVIAFQANAGTPQDAWMTGIWGTAFARRWVGPPPSRSLALREPIGRGTAACFGRQLET
jgi:hypothetical protein